jgi:predicted nucleic acid-binding protein
MRRSDVVADASVFVAALDPFHERHGAVCRILDGLFDELVSDKSVLVTHTDAITTATALLEHGGIDGATDRVAALAEAFEVVPLHEDLLRDARWVAETAADHGTDLPLQTALTIELLRRRGTRRVVSLDPLLSLFDLERLLDGQSNPA